MIDRILVGLGSAIVLAGVAVAARPAPDTATTRGPEFAPRRASEEPAYATAELPPGVRIDPQTLELVGLELDAGEGGVVVPWSRLRAYEYQPELAGLPASISELDGRRVVMAGFLLPLYEFDDIREFHLVASHWSCCFGVPPGLTGWVAVRLAPGTHGLPNTVDPITVDGTFRVREQKEAGYVVAIYAIDDARAAILR